MTDLNLGAFGANDPEPTGGMLVVMAPDVSRADAMRALERGGLGAVATTQGFGAAELGAADLEASGADAVYFERLGIALIRGGAMRSAEATAQDMARGGGVLFSRPEYMMHPLDAFAERYGDWAREGLRILIETGGAPFGGAGRVVEQGVRWDDDAAATWGVYAVGADRSGHDGAGVRVAVLDTGYDASHPDLQGRVFRAESFVPGESVDDQHGHGTHCLGTIAGPAAQGSRPRYGVAPGAEVFVGKVLGRHGGAEAWLLAGMERALALGCQVISMSLGAYVRPGQGPDLVYETAGRNALRAGCLPIAAAGNDSRRQRGVIAPVGAPANASTIMGVGAIDRYGRVADFSNGAINGDGGEVDVVGPGVDVFSAGVSPRYGLRSGTSMATPHVAGVAALLAQSDPRLRGAALWSALVDGALDLGQPRRDVGAGLVQAPLGGAPAGAGGVVEVSGARARRTG